MNEDISTSRADPHAQQSSTNPGVGRRPGWWPWPLGELVVAAAVLLAVVTMAATVGMWAWPYQEWVRTSAQFHELLQLVGPLVAVAAAGYAGRLSGRQTIYGLRSSVRMGRQVARRGLSTLLIWLVPAYLVGLAPITIITVAQAEWGRPYPLAMLTGPVALAAFIAIGYAAGTITGSAWIAPLAGLACYGIAILPAVNYAYSALIPVTEVPLQVGSTETLPVVIYRLVVAAVVIVLFTTLAGVVLAVRNLRELPIVGIATGAGLLALAVVVPLAWTPAPYTPRAAPDRICVQQNGLEYCVHPAHVSQLQPMIQGASSVFALTGGPPDGVRQVQDYALMPTWRREPQQGRTISRETRRRAREHTLVVRMIPRQTTQKEAHSHTALRMSGYQTCIRNNQFVSQTPFRAAQTVRSALLGAVNNRPASSTGLYSYSDSELTQWYRQHRRDILGCSLKPDDFPAGTTVF